MSDRPLSIGVKGDQLALRMPSGDNPNLRMGQTAMGWTLRWLGGTPGNPEAILETTTAGGGELLFWSAQGPLRSVRKPEPGKYAPPAGSQPYAGRTLDEVLASAPDILGNEVRAAGEPSYERVVGLLPPVRGRRYQVLGSPLSRGKVIMWPSGAVTSQRPGDGAVIYDPARADARVAGCRAYDGLLDDWMPMACYRFEGDEEVYDLIAFVPPEEYGVRPALFTRLTRYRRSDYAIAEEHYLRPGYWQGDDLSKAGFYAALDAAVRYWWTFEASLTEVVLPEERAWRWTKGCLALATTTFCGDHPKYGAFHYAGEEHDTFPPTLLTTGQATAEWGATRLAHDYMKYYLEKITRADGSFNYYGPSGTEYAQWLWLLNETEKCSGVQPWISQSLDKVIATGRLLEGLRRPVDNTSLRLIELGAEADNRQEIHTYFSNNLWGVRGLSALAELVRRRELGREATQFNEWAGSLAQDVREAARRYSEPADVGPLIPSFIGYPADMWTLSVGPPLPEDVPSWEQAAYLSGKTFSVKSLPDERTVGGGRETSASDEKQRSPRQWMRENTYANYRYHLEALSAMALEPEHAEALRRLRKERGGELLGMTRFMGWLDDWPVASYARYLMDTDRIDDYLLLYYAHMAHHGNRETLTYYEQVTADGQARADDSVPCLLVTPMMTRWMLCYEPVHEDALYLLRGVPRAWLNQGQTTAARGLVTRMGAVDVEVSVGAGYVEAALVLPAMTETIRTYLDIRLPDGRFLKATLRGAQWISEIQEGYRLVLAPGAQGDVTMAFAIEEGDR